jgi:hypothetical protein
MPEPIEETYSAVRGRFNGDLLGPGHNGYEDARVIWNGMVAKKPGLIARSADVGDVQNAIRIAPKSLAGKIVIDLVTHVAEQ